MATISYVSIFNLNTIEAKTGRVLAGADALQQSGSAVRRR